MSENRFGLTPLGETLRSGVPGSMRNIAIAETDAAHWLTWGKFTAAVKEGRKMTVDALGLEPWDDDAKHPEDGQQFSRAMTDISGLATGPVLAAYDFAGMTKIVDVGGAHGALLRGVLEQYPHANGVLFIFRTSPKARRRRSRRTGSPVGSRSLAETFSKRFPRAPMPILSSTSSMTGMTSAASRS